MSAEKPERNKEIVELIGIKKMSFDEVRKKYNFKSKGTVFGIWRRNKEKYLIK